MRKELKLIVSLTYFFIVGILIYNVSIGNMEFLGYAIFVGLLYFILIKADDYYKFPPYSIWLFSIWIMTHFLGGAVHINGTRLYDIILIPILGAPYHILKYDQLIHAYTYFAISILVYFMMKKHFRNGDNKSLIVFSVLAAIGIGLLNEVIEFGMVIFADAADAVGGYYNTALDLVFNLVGAIIGVWFVSGK
ncbi:DUF2238 domain-containing protein [archaeon]|jgi:hypothetical protein|nr:DUF2238 domain-containing protein [archaeon]MBT6606148.1 DUF2238 domain-containing protein [archaeon]MBT7252012.1 DUF2238 domain-containing protein [archaeon]MBT7660922.1 DUF2238 domain-containing protein [archaeon]